MAGVIEKLLAADLVIWSFPLYYFNVPGILKTMIDRQLPMSRPFMSSRDDGYGSGSHDSRYKGKGGKHVLVFTCGFWSSEGNYDSVTSMLTTFSARAILKRFSVDRESCSAFPNYPLVPRSTSAW